MWKIRKVKSNGRHSMKKNFAACLIVSIIMVFLVSGPLSITETMDTYINYMDRVSNDGDLERLSRFVDSLKEIEDTFKNATSVGSSSSAGVISSLYHSSKKTGTIGGGVLLIFDKLFLKGDVSTSIIIGFGVLIAVMFSIFVKNVLRVGAARFFMDNGMKNHVRVSDIIMVYRMRRTMHCAWIMLFRMALLLLWFLTVIGGIIKFYSYRMVPYILAENPSISRKEAFRISMQLMKGNKLRTLLLDLTFVPWWILSVLTFGIVQYLYLEPYMRSAYAELYIQLRGEELNIVPLPPVKKEHHFDYHRTYSLTNLILIFFVFSVFGWIWECTVFLIQEGHFVNRGSLYGPWIPIYGFGGIGLIVLLKRFIDRPAVTFILAVMICGILEGTTGWFLNTVEGMRYWDYSNFYFNIHGYVCLEGLLIFGLGGCMFIYLLAPVLDTYFNKVPGKERIVMCTVLTAAFFSDVTYAHFHPHIGKDIGSYSKKHGR